MVEQYELDDFSGGDWVEIHYKPRISGVSTEFHYEFPTVINSISNRNNDPDEDHITVRLTPREVPARLPRKDITQIWHLAKAAH
ncbi:hypothetical protein J4218_05835 [Candidatus Pacearchaeota archaeon]|nr:hypothetical protein [Candidatus Pacearchaeota archaeon]